MYYHVELLQAIHLVFSYHMQTPIFQSDFPKWFLDQWEYVSKSDIITWSPPALQLIDLMCHPIDMKMVPN